MWSKGKSIRSYYEKIKKVTSPKRGISRQPRSKGSRRDRRVPDLKRKFKVTHLIGYLTLVFGALRIQDILCDLESDGVSNGWFELSNRGSHFDELIMQIQTRTELKRIEQLSVSVGSGRGRLGTADTNVDHGVVDAGNGSLLEGFLIQMQFSDIGVPDERSEASNCKICRRHYWKSTSLVPTWQRLTSRELEKWLIRIFLEIRRVFSQRLNGGNGSLVQGRLALFLVRHNIIHLELFFGGASAGDNGFEEHIFHIRVGSIMQYMKPFSNPLRFSHLRRCSHERG